ncbi:hypothetical protein [Bartonella sp. cb54]|uniref:hypothetical protein n=1 Tax=Bartonella sp. cb54 TaxID=3385560 RepID=UPI0039A4B098
MSTIDLFSYDIYVNSKPINTKDADAFFGKLDIKNTPDNNKVITLTAEKLFVNSNTYYLICASTGKSNPYNPEVIDIEDNDLSATSNPRPKKFVELKIQHFGVLIPQTSTLFSSSRKLNDLLKKYLQASIHIAPAIANAQVLEERLSSVKEIKMEYKQSKQLDLFTMSSSEEIKNSSEEIKKIAAHETGLFFSEDISEFNFTLSATLKEENNTKTRVKKLLSQEDHNHNFKKLSFVGKTYNNFDAIFNTETFQYRMSIEINKDENGMYNKDDVKTKLVNQMKNFMQNSTHMTAIN